MTRITCDYCFLSLQGYIIHRYIVHLDHIKVNVIGCIQRRRCLICYSRWWTWIRSRVNFRGISELKDEVFLVSDKQFKHTIKDGMMDSTATIVIIIYYFMASFSSWKYITYMALKRAPDLYDIWYHDKIANNLVISQYLFKIVYKKAWIDGAFSIRSLRDTLYNIFRIQHNLSTVLPECLLLILHTSSSSSSSVVLAHF